MRNSANCNNYPGYTLSGSKCVKATSSLTSVYGTWHEETRYSSFEESIKEKRYLTKKDIDDLVMAFIYLIHNQETDKDNLSNMLERVDSFPYLKRALVNYYYIRTEEFKKRCLMKDETKQEDVVRMLKENCDLGLPNLFYLSLLK